MEFLYTAKRVKEVVEQLFKGKTNRIIVSGFIGSNILKKLKIKPEGLKVYCWDHPICTNPKAIREMLDSNVEVFFVNNLHSKIYLNQKSFVITSANFSLSGFGYNRQKEIGLLCDRNEDLFNVEELIKSFGKFRKVGQKEIDLFESKFNFSQNKKEFPNEDNGKIPTYVEWFESKNRKPWKFEYFTGYQDFLKNSVKNDGSKPNNWIYVKENNFAKNDLILSIKVTTNLDQVIKYHSFDWIFAEKIVINGDYIQATQYSKFNELKDSIPFKINKKFLDAIYDVLNEQVNLRQILKKENSFSMNILKKIYMKCVE